jgi:hypothetical protein
LVFRPSVGHRQLIGNRSRHQPRPTTEIIHVDRPGNLLTRAVKTPEPGLLGIIWHCCNSSPLKPNANGLHSRFRRVKASFISPLIKTTSTTFPVLQWCDYKESQPSKLSPKFGDCETNWSEGKRGIRKLAWTFETPWDSLGVARSRKTRLGSMKHRGTIIPVSIVEAHPYAVYFTFTLENGLVGRHAKELPIAFLIDAGFHIRSS